MSDTYLQAQGRHTYFLAAILFAVHAFPGRVLAASDLEDILPRDKSMEVKSALTPAELHRRTELVLRHFGVPHEADRSAVLRSLDGMQSLAGLQGILPFLDPKQQFSRWSTTANDSLHASLDRDSRLLPDWSVSLARAGAPLPQPAFIQRLRRAATTNPSDRPLAGLRIALDPGHMGGARWDRLTGKYIRDAATGAELSEGVLNLQTSLLLEREFQRLGATTLITHRGLEPVTRTPYESLDVDAYARAELNASRLQNWFLGLLEGAESGLMNAFASDANFKKLFNESSRSPYFILRADLQARVELIEAFTPDITLIIHYDAAAPASDPNGVNPRGPSRTKAYVAGAFMETEFATRASRSRFAEHALNPAAWGASVALSRHVVNQISTDLTLPLDPQGGPGDPIAVEPGVYSRNLSLTQRLAGHAVSYLEVLFYNQGAEFNALRQVRHPLTIDGVDWPYSDRLLRAVHAIRDGTLRFAQSFNF